MNNNLIKKIEEKVITAAKSKNNKFGFGAWSHHIKYVVEYGEKIALMKKADIEIVKIACLLHDYASLIDYSLYPEHHIHGAIEAQKILENFKYPQEKIDLIKKCIISHRGSKDIRKKSIEEECVAEADAVSHIVQVPSLLFLAYKEKGLGIDEGKEFVKNKLNRTWKKITPEVQEIVLSKYNSALIILD